MNRIGILLIISVVGITINLVAKADTGISASNIMEAKVKSMEKQLPIMLVFYESDCDNCRVVDEEFIKPMIISGDYNNKVILVYIDVERDKIRNFNNELQGLEIFMDRFAIELLPTVSFVDEKGEKLIESISGVSNIEYYGSLLDEAIEKSLMKINHSKP